MARILFTGECCGDIDVSSGEVVVAVSQHEKNGVALCRCTECNGEVSKNVQPDIVLLLMYSGVRLATNVDTGDPEVRRRLLDGEPLFATSDELGSAVATRELRDVETPADLEQQLGMDGNPPEGAETN